MVDLSRHSQEQPCEADHQYGKLSGQPSKPLESGKIVEATQLVLINLSGRLVS